MQRIFHHHFLIAILLNTILFSGVVCLLTCCLNTDTDIYFLYTLSGGFGNEPSSLLHYPDVAHPLLSSIVTFFFSRFPSFNWYSFFLLSFHFACCIVFLYSLLNSFKRLYSIIVFLVFFLFLECRLLLWLDYSGAALIGVVSGSFSLLLYLKAHIKPDKKRLFLFCALIFIGGLIRIHYIALFSVFSIWMAFFFLNRKQLVRFVGIQLFLGLLVVLCFQGQRYYFEKTIPGWSQEEKFRKAHIYYSNHPRTSALSVQAGREKLKQDLINLSLVYDTTFTDYNSIKAYGENNTKLINLSADTSRGLYWLFIDLRVYLLLFFAAGIFLFVELKSSLRFIYTSLFFVLTYFLLGLFLKTTEVLLVTVLTGIVLSAVLSLGQPFAQRRAAWTGIGLLVLSAVWMTIRLGKISSQNKNRISMARNIITELNAHSSMLFVNAGAPFNLNLSIWDSPQKYPLHNFVYSELFYANSYHSQLERFNIKNLMEEIPISTNIFIVGQKPEPLIGYYKLLYKEKVEVQQEPGFKFMNAYRVSRVN